MWEVSYILSAHRANLPIDRHEAMCRIPTDILRSQIVPHIYHTFTSFYNYFIHFILWNNFSQTGWVTEGDVTDGDLISSS